MVGPTLTVSQAILYYGKELYGEDFNLDDPKRKRMYYNFYLYFAGKEQCPYPLDKSLLLIGDVGVGKSSLFKIYQQIFHSFKILPAKQPEKDLSDYSDDRNVRFPAKHVLDLHGAACKKQTVIDDAGTETSELFLFKNKFTIMDEILYERYDLFVKEKIKTHFTSNLDTGALKDLYGERLFDRLKEMTTVITWQGKSLRGNNGAKK